MKTLPARWQFCSCLPSLCTYPISIDSPLKQVLAYILSKSKAEAFKWSCQKVLVFAAPLFDLTSEVTCPSCPTFQSGCLGCTQTSQGKKTNAWKYQTTEPKSQRATIWHLGSACHPFYHYTPCWRCLLILLETEVAALLIRVIYREMLFWHSTLG